MKLLQSHEDYVKSVLEDLFYNKLSIEQRLYYPFDNLDEYLKYGNSFIHSH